MRPVVCVRESARARERESERERKFVCGGGKVRRMDLLVCVVCVRVCACVSVGRECDGVRVSAVLSTSAVY